MRKKIVYISKDGKEFENECACLHHEQNYDSKKSKMERLANDMKIGRVSNDFLIRHFFSDGSVMSRAFTCAGDFRVMFKILFPFARFPSKIMFFRGEQFESVGFEEFDYSLGDGFYLGSGYVLTEVVRNGAATYYLFDIEYLLSAIKTSFERYLTAYVEK